MSLADTKCEWNLSGKHTDDDGGKCPWGYILKSNTEDEFGSNKLSDAEISMLRKYAINRAPESIAVAMISALNELANSRVGTSPVQRIQDYAKEHQLYATVTMTYDCNGWWDSAEVKFFRHPDYKNPVKEGWVGGVNAINPHNNPHSQN